FSATYNIYDDAVPVLRKDVTHPYSLREFAGDTQEYQWKMNGKKSAPRRVSESRGLTASLHEDHDEPGA
ncbi:uncharacterized protein B0H18DRAFT_977948, partial [Fomitopsis serialis]|uniref:uncharacterized protein n=1 Tax=Fomitopsis serialis TaxID=139415 RepID=UPI00200816BD